ncbi:2,4-dienoyl-CoA reductase-like NADH-dependent reductase (Old Yellow Enzyme family) [Bradyrhizobium barranii subsp. barranii]
MSALFSPIKLRGLTLKNRVVVSPMCQYSADDGVATDWHFTHINNLALSGASMFCIEATHVEAIGRITPGCLGLYSDACEAALKQILSSVRKHSTTGRRDAARPRRPQGLQRAALGRRPAHSAK